MAVPPQGPGPGGPGQPPHRGVPGQMPPGAPPPPGAVPPYPQGLPGAVPPGMTGPPGMPGGNMPPGMNYPPAYPQQPGFPQPPYPQQPGYPQQPPYRAPFGVPQVPGGAYPQNMPPAGMPGAVPQQPVPGQPQYPPPPGGVMPPGMPGYANAPRPGFPQPLQPPAPQQYGGGTMFPNMAPPPPGAAPGMPPRPGNVPGTPPPPTNMPPRPGVPAQPAPVPRPQPAAPRPVQQQPMPPQPVAAPPQPASPPNPAPPVPPAALKPAAPKPLPPKPIPPKQPAAMPSFSPTKPDAADDSVADKLVPGGIVDSGKSDRDEPEEPSDPWTEFKEELRKNSIPWSVSFVLHLVLIIALGILSISKRNSVRVTLEASLSDTPGEKRAADVRTLDMSTPDPVQLADNRPIYTPTAAVAIVTPVSPFGVGKVSAVRSISTPPALAGRGMKSSLLGDYGGTEESEDAVKSGLYWLKRHQMENGLWSLTGKGGMTNAKYSKGADKENYEAATAMALLAFLGGGHTHKAGDFTDVVHNGAYELVRRQDPSGNFYRSEMLEETMYTQAQCTMAVCELYGMTKDVEPDFVAAGRLSNAMLKKSCEMALKYCLEAQDPAAGGWRYRPRSGSDTSVTGWMVMALISARNAGFTVPQESLDLVSAYLDLAARGPGNMINPNTTVVTSATPGVGMPKDFGSKYSYMPHEDYTPSMTAEGLLCRMYLGWSHDDPRLVTGVNLLLDHLPQWKERDVYFWYYATQTMFHMEGKFWKTWNMALRDMLTARQEKAGSENGSWDPVDREGPDLWALNKKGGRLYVTCFSLYMLEVYYRHLPLYSDLKKQMEATTKKKS